MSDFDNTNSGVLFKNDRKEKDEDRDYNGTINVGGTECWLSAWIKTSKKDGRKFMSLKVKPKDEAKPAPVDRRPVCEALDDEIPF